MNIEEIKKDFPLLQNRNITYLDSGATTQKPRQVLDAVSKYYENYNANAHRGAYSLSIEATEEYEKARAKVDENNLGTGSFRTFLIDALYQTDAEELINESKIKIL